MTNTIIEEHYVVRDLSSSVNFKFGQFFSRYIECLSIFQDNCNKLTKLLHGFQKYSKGTIAMFGELPSENFWLQFWNNSPSNSVGL